MNKEEIPIIIESEKLQCWFELSYASFLTLPRVLMQSMPIEWQNKMADLLNEYEEAFPNMPEGMGSTVRITHNGRIVPTPEWLTNYRHPDHEAINRLRNKQQ